jgi:hypothetical protein
MQGLNIITLALGGISTQGMFSLQMLWQTHVWYNSSCVVLYFASILVKHPLLEFALLYFFFVD